jgi:hypothetical protein
LATTSSLLEQLVLANLLNEDEKLPGRKQKTTSIFFKVRLQWFLEGASASFAD